LYNWRQVCNKWLSQRHEQKHDISWKAHNAPVYATALLHFDGSHLLVTAGGDGLVKLWPLDSILTAAAAAAEDGGDCCLQASAEVLLPHLQNPLGISDGRQPAAQVLAVDQQHQQVFIGEHQLLVSSVMAYSCSSTVTALVPAKPSNPQGSQRLIGATAPHPDNSRMKS
jgi:WD40 repeat protein